MHRFIFGLSRLMAILGGVVLTALVLLVCVSVLGRSVNTILHMPLFDGALSGVAAWLLGRGIGPITGDFELVEAGMAFTIFAFLPLTQITSGHATVDIFTSWLPQGPARLLRAIIEAVFALVLVMIAVQLWAGMESKLRSGQTTFLLQFPVWWSYALSLFAAAVAAVVGVYMALVRLAEAVTGRAFVDDGTGAEH